MAGAGASSDTAEIGANLREARLALGHDLVDVADELRIRHVYLQAIEEGRLDVLPGPAYVAGFLRVYGDYLGLDGREIVNRYRTAGGAGADGTDLRLLSPIEEGRLPTRPILVLAALLAAGAYGAWYYMADNDGEPVEIVAALPDRLAAPTDGPVAVATPDPSQAEEAASEALEPADGGGEETVSAETPSAGVDVPADAAVTAPTGQQVQDTASPAPDISPGEAQDTAAADRRTRTLTETAAVPAAPAPAGVDVPPDVAAPAPAETDPSRLLAPASPEAGDGGAEQRSEAPPAVRVVLRASADSWIEIGTDGAAPIYSGVLRRGQSYQVPARPGLTLRTGNAGGFDVMVDGQAIPRLGPRGAVRRGIVLDADGLLGLPGR